MKIKFNPDIIYRCSQCRSVPSVSQAVSIQAASGDILEQGNSNTNIDNFNCSNAWYLKPFSMAILSMMVKINSN